MGQEPKNWDRRSLRVETGGAQELGQEEPKSWDRSSQKLGQEELESWDRRSRKLGQEESESWDRRSPRVRTLGQEELESWAAGHCFAPGSPVSISSQSLALSQLPTGRLCNGSLQVIKP